MKYTKIKSNDQYNRYCEIHEKLVYENEHTNRDEIELIQILIDEYEQRDGELPLSLNPVELLTYLLEENEISKSQLAREINVSRQLVTDILNYRRNISKKMINKLSDRFRLQPIAFSKPYELKNQQHLRQTA